jgi:hypothetical protein
MSAHELYYGIKPLIPRIFQIFLRRVRARFKRKVYSSIWPIDERSGKIPDGWKGWPDAKKFAIVMTHDVELELGQSRCKMLAELEQKLGFKSSFNFVPERYKVSAELCQYIVESGSEVGVHGLYHDGKLYKSREIFMDRAVKINKYLADWGAVGFRSPSMHHNLDWLHDLNIQYDLSTFDTDPFEPQPDGVNTIFPFWVNHKTSGKCFLELPYTIAQDSTLFIILNEKNINIWKRKVDWIAERGGMVLANTHPDYMSFNGKRKKIQEYPVEYYAELLEYFKTKYENQYWHVLPKEMAAFWLDTYGRNKIVKIKNKYKIRSLKQ